MNEKNDSLFNYIKNLCESDLNLVIHFVLGMTSINEQLPDKPSCPYCGSSHVIKYGYKDGKQHFLCKDCQKTYMHTTNTLMANSHFDRLVWINFIRDTFYGKLI